MAEPSPSPGHIVIVGGVAAGATAAARIRRLSEAPRITLLERSPYVSYANCGLPYYIGGDIKERDRLFVQTPEGFRKRYNVDVRVNAAALDCDPKGKRLLVKDADGSEAWLHYDKLILAQGGNAVSPQGIPGTDHPSVFKLWRVGDMDGIDGYIKAHAPAAAVVMGGGFVGLEMAEAFAKRGLRTTVVEFLPTVMAAMDAGFGRRVAGELRANGVEVRTGVAVKAYHPEAQEVELSDGSRVPAGIVLVSVGVRPELDLARKCGVAISDKTGAVLVDEHLCTSDPDILAAGDMVEVCHKVSGRQVRMGLAGPANRQGRIAGSNAMGLNLRYSGVLGTSVCQIFDATVASTGLSEKAARDAGFEVGVAEIVKEHHAGYFPGAQELTLRLVYDKAPAARGKLLGAQAFGRAGVEKRVDAAAVALQGGLALSDLAEVDLSYAPPYSSANDPLNLAAFVGMNDLSGFSPLSTPARARAALYPAAPAPATGGGSIIKREEQQGASTAGPVLLDVRTPAEWRKGHVKGALHIPIDDLRARLAEVPKAGRGPLFVHCKGGYRGHLALRILVENGHTDVFNVTGGFSAILAEGGFDIETAV